MKTRITISKNTNLNLSNQEIEEIKQDHKYDKIYKTNFKKVKRTVEQKIYFKKTFLWDILMIALASLGTTIAMDYFVSATGSGGLFPGGVGTIARFFSIILNDKISHLSESSLFFIFLFIINLPLFIFGFINVGIKFTLTSILFILSAIMWDQIITRIPVINPQEFVMIISYKIISQMPSEWSVTIWLFVFAFIGAIFLGASYSLTYKVGSSTAGTDFVTCYFAQKYNKQIGSVNMKINFVILIIVVFLNALIIPMNQVNSLVKLNVLNSLNNDQFRQVYENAKNSGVFSNNQASPLYLPTDWDPTKTEWTKQQIAEFIARNYKFQNYTNQISLLIRAQFIFGPSLFASFVLLIVQSIVIDRIYPKNKLITILISTNKPNEMKNYLFDSGYRNNIDFLENQTIKKGSTFIKQSVIMITLSLVDWKKLENGAFNIDKDLALSIIRNMQIKGSFNYSLDTEKREFALIEKVLSDKKLMKKIETKSILMTKQKNNKHLNHKNQNL